MLQKKSPKVFQNKTEKMGVSSSPHSKVTTPKKEVVLAQIRSCDFSNVYSASSPQEETRARELL